MDSAHLDLKVTVDGAPAQIVNYQDKFTVKEAKTAWQLAEQQTGPKATLEQIEAFAQQIVARNYKPFAPTDKLQFKQAPRSGCRDSLLMVASIVEVAEQPGSIGPTDRIWKHSRLEMDVPFIESPDRA